MMDSNNWRPTGQGESGIDGGDWRSQLSPDSRQRIVNKIIETLKRHLPVPVLDGLVELRKIAERFEEKIYTAATSQADYLRKISLKMLSLESKSQTGVNNSLLSTSGGNQNPQDAGQSLPIPMGNQPPQRQQLIPQNLQNAMGSGTVQNSPNIQPALSSVTGLTQTAMSGVGQNSNLQTMSGISQNSMNNPLGQGVQSNMFSSSQRQMQRQHPQQVLPQQHQQQAQNPQQFYQQQYQQQMIKQKLQQGNLQSSLLPTHMQQQQQQQQASLLQSNQMQPSHLSHMQISSGLQSSQSMGQQIQPSMMQSAGQSSLQQNHLQANQLASVQQSGHSGLQQHSQSILRQQQQSQQPSMHQQTSVLQQQTQVKQQHMLPSQKQQLMVQQPNATNIQQNQLLAQQNSVPDMQQQQQMLLSQHNNLSNMHQQQLMNQQNKNMRQSQQLVQQSSVSGLQQQQQLMGSQPGSGVSNMQHQHSVNLLQQPKVAAQQQQQQQQQPPQLQPTSTTLLPSQGQQAQSQPSQQQLLSQSQSPQLQQQMGLQQQPNALQREVQLRMQNPGALLQSQNTIEPQKQLFQPQRSLPEASSTSIDSASQTGHAGGLDWQEEIYQKMKTMKELYLPDLTEMHQRIAMKCQQHEALVPQAKQSDPIDKLKFFGGMLERFIKLLQMPKSSISPAFKEKLSQYEKQIISIINSNKTKKTLPAPQGGQQQLQQSVGQTQSLTQQPQSKIPQLQQQDNLANSMQPLNMQGSVTSMQSTSGTNLQHGSMHVSAPVAVPTSHQNVMNTLQTGSNLESTAGHTLNSLPQGVVGSIQQTTVGSLQQNTVNAPQQTNIGTMAQNNLNQLQPNVNSLQPHSNLLQQQHLKQHQQEQQLMQSQQFKQQYQHRQMLQLMQQKQQMMQQPQQQQMQQQFQQQQLHQQKQQQHSQLQAQQLPQLHQMSELNESKARPGASVKSGPFPQSHLSNQRGSTFHQQLKSSPFPMSSPQLLQAVSPQVSQNSSPQVDQQNLVATQPKTGTPLQSANSPFIGNSPSPAPSLIPGDSEKLPSTVSSLSNVGNIGHQQTTHGLTQAQSLAIGTPGISASPLLAEFSGLDGTHANASMNVSGKSNATERPLERLIKVVRSISPKAFSSSVCDIGSVVSMIDRIAGSAPGNGSRAAVGEDLVAMTKCRLQARNFMSQDGSASTKKMRRHTSAMPLNAVSSAGSVNNSFKQLSSLETSELESTATSRMKRHKVEANHTLLEEVREINQRLIDTVVEISDEDAGSISDASGSEGIFIKCSFNAVALSPNLKSQYASAQMSPIMPLRLLIPANYPRCSPILLDKLPGEPSKEFEDLSVKAKLRFNRLLRSLSQPISLGEIAVTWDVCTRKVIAEYAQQNGGGSFSSRYGTWENCVSA